ncbi:hypothetical protein M3J09_010232 [Ascochyta lentis]
MLYYNKACINLASQLRDGLMVAGAVELFQESIQRRSLYLSEDYR